MKTRARRVVKVVDNTALARQIGARVRAARLEAGLTQAELAGDRYTPAYISALETANAKPSMASLRYIADRLGVPMRRLLDEHSAGWNRLAADLHAASGDWQAAADTYDQLLEVATATREKAELQRGLAEAYCRLGRPQDAVRIASEAATSFEHLRRPGDRAWALYWLAYAHHRLENFSEARSLLEHLREDVRAGLGVSPEFEFRVLTSLGAVTTAMGKPREALAYLAEAEGVGSDLDIRHRAALLFAQALNYQTLGDLEAAVSVGTKSMALFSQANLRSDLASMKNQMALTYLALGQARRAQRLAAEAEEIARGEGDERLLAFVLETSGQIAFAQGEHERAQLSAEQAAELAERWNLPSPRVHAALLRARIALAAGKPTDADQAFAEACALAAECDVIELRKRALGEWAASLAQRGHHAEANKRYQEALSGT